MGYDNSRCCSGKVICKKPYSFNDVKPECVFVEKVFDSRIVKTQVQASVPRNAEMFPINTVIDEIVEITEIICKVKNFKVQEIKTKINGKEPEAEPIIGPGGIEQIDLTDPALELDTSKCDKIKKGTKIKVKQELKLDKNENTVELIVKGIGKNNGALVNFTSQPVEVNLKEDVEFYVGAKLCIPSLKSAVKPSLASFCAASCIADPDDFNFRVPGTDKDRIQLLPGEGEIMYCITCEKKIKVPAQICVLTTGLCKQKTEFDRICEPEDFPPLFPVQLNDCGDPRLFGEEEEFEVEEVEVIEEPFEENIAEKEE